MDLLTSVLPLLRSKIRNFLLNLDGNRIPARGVAHVHGVLLAYYTVDGDCIHFRIYEAAQLEPDGWKNGREVWEGNL